MSDKQKPDRPRGRRPSYLTGPVGSAKPLPASGGSEIAPGRKKEAVREEAKPDVQLYSWKIWLLPRRPAVSAAVVIALIGCVGIAYWALPQVLFVGIISLILLNRLAPYLFPVTFVLTEETVGYKTFLARDVRQWGRIFTYYQFPDGVLLANDVRSVRGRFREGLFLYFEAGGANKDEVLRVVQSKVKSPKEAVAPASGGHAYKGGVGSALRRIRKLRGKE